MAIRKPNSIQDTQTKQVYQLPEFEAGSKMKRYELFFDEDYNNKPRCGYYSNLQFDQSNLANMNLFEVTIEYEHRLDLIALKFLGSTAKTWILEDINDIKDSVKDVVVGKILKIPSEMEVMEILS